MNQVLLADDYPHLLAAADLGAIRVVALAAGSPCLDASYALLASTFAPEVLEPKSSFVAQFATEAIAPQDYLPCSLTALVAMGDADLVVGVLAADVIWLAGSEGASFLAVRNVATSPLCRGRGIGSLLFEGAIDLARQLAARQSRKLECIVLESEERSLGFWEKLGFRWPRGMLYFQPPLEWTDEGLPVHKEVRETLLVAPADPAVPLLLKGDDVKAIVTTLYENWSLRDYRDQLSPAAMARAEEYVRTQVAEKVLDSIACGAVDFVEPLEARKWMDSTR